MKIEGRSLFSILVFAAALVFVALSPGYSAEGRLFPLIVGIPTVILSGYQAFVDLRASGGGGGLDLFGVEKVRRERGTEEDEYADVPPDLYRKRLIEITAWILGFALLLYAFGIMVGFVLFTLLFFLAVGEKLWLNLALTAGTWLAVYVLFELILRVPFYEGWIRLWLKG